VVDAAEQDVTAGTMDGHAVLKAVAIPGKRFDVWNYRRNIFHGAP
jgi:hypothetical protein